MINLTIENGTFHPKGSIKAKVPTPANTFSVFRASHGCEVQDPKLLTSKWSNADSRIFELKKTAADHGGQGDYSAAATVGRVLS